jgi:hypothetical protein
MSFSASRDPSGYGFLAARKNPLPDSLRLANVSSSTV